MWNRRENRNVKVKAGMLTVVLSVFNTISNLLPWSWNASSSYFIFIQTVIGAMLTVYFGHGESNSLFSKPP